MAQHDTRIRLEDSLYKNYKIICVKNDLSIQKQTVELIRKFVEISHENERRLQHIKR